MAQRFSSTTLYAALGSIAVHALAAFCCLTSVERPATRPHVQTVEFTLLEPATTAAAPLAATDWREPVAEPARPRPRKASTSTPTEPAVSGREPVSQAEPVSAEAPAEDAVTARVPSAARARAVDLSPLAAALTLRDSLSSRGRCEATLADAAVACAGEAEDAGAASRATTDSVRQELAGLRKELQLTPERDGSYGFDGPSFRATVARDGRVSFHDKIQDLNTFVEHHFVGAQINTSEKRRFMESTKALRERLAATAEEQNQRRAKLALKEALPRILEQPGTSLHQKRRSLFELWDDCAGDSGGREAQAIIEAFIREHLPEGSALGYSAAELAQLNRTRISRHAFDPYASPDAGVQPG